MHKDLLKELQNESLLHSLILDNYIENPRKLYFIFRIKFVVELICMLITLPLHQSFKEAAVAPLIFKICSSSFHMDTTCH